MTNFIERGCSGKRKYATRKFAKKAALRLRHREQNGAHVSAYRCGLCIGYHIGHNNVHNKGVVWDYIPDRTLSLF